MSSQEKMFLASVFMRLPDAKIALVLSVILIPCAGLLSLIMEITELPWHFFVIAEGSAVLLFLIDREWQKMIELLPSIESHRVHTPPLNKRIFLLYFCLIGFIVLLSVNTVYHFRILFSPSADVNREIIIIVISFIGIGLSTGLLMALPVLTGIITQRQSKT